MPHSLLTMQTSTDRPFLSLILPVLNEAATIHAQVAVLQELRGRGTELLLVDGGSSDGTPDLARPGVDRLLESPCGRASQMNAGANASQGEVLLFLHADTTLPPAADGLIRAAIAGGAAWGRFDVRIDGRQPLLRVVESMMNWRSRLTGIATGDPGGFHSARGVREGGWLSGVALDGGHCLVETAQAHLPTSLPARTGTDLRATLAETWRSAHDSADVAPARELFFWCGPAATGDSLRLCCRASAEPLGIAVFARAPQAGAAKTRLIPALGAVGAARLQRRLTLHALAVARRAAIGRVTLWGAPDDSSISFGPCGAVAASICAASRRVTSAHAWRRPSPGTLGHCS